jgi:hypothetical protein
MANTFTKIASVTVGAGGAASMSFTSIPSTYTDLCIKVSARTTDANIAQSMYMTVNGGAQGSVLSQKWLVGDGSTAAAGSYSSIGLVYPFYIPGSSATSNTFGNGEIYISNYASTTINKSMSTDGVTENNATAARAELDALLFGSNTAISSLLFGPGAGNFVQYTTATLYGIKNS